MSDHAAFLRGMNLGRRRITNGELCKAFAALGLSDVHAFRASGNVAFSAPEMAPGALAELIGDGLHAALGYAVPTHVRSAAELAELVAARPFPPAAVRASEGKLHVAMFAAQPSAALRKQVLALATDDDRLAVGARELFWLPRGRLTDSLLDLKRLEGLLGPWTMRTKATIEQLAAKHFPGLAPGGSAG
jgi:uncharacterized protein (DUF1697 family)